MKFRYQQAFRACILLAFSAMIFSLHWTGDIKKLINPKYNHLSIVAALLFFILFLVQVTRILSLKKESHCQHCCSSHDHGDSAFTTKKYLSYTIIIIPILTGFLMPAQILGSTIADKKGGVMMLTNQQQMKIEDYVTSNQPIVDNIYDHEPDPALLDGRKEMKENEYELLRTELSKKEKITMTEEDYIIYYDEINNNIAQHIGKRIQLNGFVLKEKEFAEDQLVISRFFVTHCIADANIVGFLSEFPEAASLDEDTWIEAMGTIDVTEFDGALLPVIKIEQWVKIQEPETPYLYPIDVWITS
ncbi:TIGR03943 family protein [Metasolibacillus sp.]|uniref:TIGR03943 family putative permease subunit n=1 Tax=Metasolibacillus sp. TaxID=2703680 RepID=UPI0025CD5391|nr:TIGR03943 family protein [Metasolibacillus sp.]MCT6924649.1 TIGR03943 family protein [Metasolibacillus sp.]MCT6940851.1 TIGR03943 family protein [Metasolibacillus sp.]